MPNQHVVQRLDGISKMLMGAHAAGGSSSNATRGREREAFIDKFLSGVFPAPFRFGSGDITDRAGARSGQIDVVVEYPFLPSLPIVGGGEHRLYLAEGVAAAIEVKSDIAAQWSEVLSTARQITPLRRQFGSSMSMGPAPLDRVPLFAVGYTGWAKMETIQEKVKEGGIDGLLVIDRGLFCASESFHGVYAHGSLALLGLISCLHIAFSGLKATSANPIDYGL